MKKEEFSGQRTVKDNRKTRYTRRALREILIELMKSKSILRITIEDMTLPI